MGGNQEKKLTLVVDLVNKTEKKFRQVYTQLEEVEQRTEKTRQAMREIGLVGGIALGALAIGAKKAITEASNLAESVNAVNVVFGEGADKIHEFGKTSATSIGLATSQFNQMATLTGALLKDTGLEMGQVSDMTTMLSQRAADMASVFNTDVKDAMEAINQAIRGETEGIRRYAGNVTVAELEAEALAQGINKSVTEMSEQEKRLLRVSVIMKQTAVTSGDFANTSDSLANRQRILSAQFQNMAGTIGTQLIPVMESMYNTIAPIVTAVGNWVNAHPTLTKNIVLVTAAISALLVVMGVLGVILPRVIVTYGLFSKAIAAATKLLQTEITWTQIKIALQKAYATVTRVAIAAQLGMNAAMTGTIAVSKLLKIALASTGIGAIIVLLGYLAVEFYKLSGVVGGFKNAFILVWQAIKITVANSITSMIEWFGKLIDLIPGVDETFKTTVETLRAGAAEMQLDMDETALSMVEAADASTVAATDIDAAGIDMAAALAAASAAAASNGDATEEYFKKLVDSVKEIRDEIKETYDEINQANKDFMESTADAESDYRQDVVETVAGASQKIKELEKEIREAKKDDEGGDRVSELKDQLQEQQDILATYKDLKLNLDKEIAEERKRLAMNELERLTFDHEKKLLMMKKEFLEEQVTRLQKLVELKKEEAFILNSVGIQKTAAINAELEKTMTHREQLRLQKEGLGTWISDTTSMYQNYVKDINKALGDISGSGNVKVSFTAKGSGARASGGPVQPGRAFLVGEKGPELFTPGQHGAIVSNGRMGGQVVNVYFTGNHFTDERYAEQIKNKIVQDFKRTMKLSIG